HHHQLSKSTMGLISSPSVDESHYHTHKIFLFANYILLGTASSCIFLTLSLRLIPSSEENLKEWPLSFQKLVTISRPQLLTG
ncbi:hypothetical protein HID58_050759, partial [Brassica napus]